MIIVNNDERLIVIGDIKLLPGCNDVNKEEWDKLVKGEKPIYDISYLILEEKIKEIDNEFIKLKTPEKEKILSGTFNLKTLEKWKDEEPDFSVRNQILDRIKGIQTATVQVKYGKPKGHV